MKLLAFNLLAAVFLVTIQGCYYDVAEEMYPTEPCDATDFSYSSSISSIIQANCLACHSTSMAQGNVILTNYDNLKFYGQNGELLGSVRHDPGYSEMPKDGIKLKACDIKKIELWVTNGYPK
ncbi:MAG: hypothetical protein LC117_10915 [Bacteroidia bacterium]|nr:hypothetical protein [Bacteroidia bacterium]MCZ2278427.1 hypothetical protein [Bacteroidia bacterium]